MAAPVRARSPVLLSLVLVLPVVVALAGLCLLLPQAWAGQAEMVFSYRPRPVPEGQERDFEEALMRLALDHTVAAEGPYRMEAAPDRVTTPRIVQDLRRRAYPGQIVVQTATAALMQDLLYIPFPTDSGITGLRLALSTGVVADMTTEVRTVADLSRFSSVQGLGWPDVGILRDHGLPVEEISSRESMALMVARGRADLYWRGINEVSRDIAKAAETNATGLTVAPGVALFYPLPKFFFAHPADAAHLRRLERGLTAAWADGSFHALWRRYFAAAVSAVAFEGRTVFVLSNPDAGPVQDSLRRFELPEVSALRGRGRWITVQPLTAQGERTQP